MSKQWFQRFVIEAGLTLLSGAVAVAILAYAIVTMMGVIYVLCGGAR